MDLDCTPGAFQILLVEDSPADIRLTREVFKSLEMQHSLHVVTDGEEALDFLYRRKKYTEAPLPGLILLDLHLPKLDGKTVLKQIKANARLLHIPVIVLTTSNNEDDIVQSYRLHANAYITKPISVDEFEKVIRRVRLFWIDTVAYPRGMDGDEA